jgi:murein DD-endopeptidase MepM/ murein hydrolase activator NlpD
MIRLKVLSVIMLLLFLPVTASAGAKGTKPKIILSPKKVGPGDILLITVQGAAGRVEGTFNGRMLYFNPSKKSFKAVAGIDLLSELGKYDLEINCNGAKYKRSVSVSDKAYPVQRLTLPKGMVELSPENEARADREQKRIAEIWPNHTDRSWTGGFVNPREGDISTPFGVKRFINGIPKNPHTGVDVSADEGAEVRAPNSGVAVLVEEHFFAGNSVVLDHGQGIFTMFFHLSRTVVEPGQAVKKGDVIGLVGSTGRSTGPHLHWGARMQGTRIDPLQLINLNLE